MTSLSGRRFCVYIVYHPPSGTKLSGTETDFYSDLDILFTEASISTLPVIILGDFKGLMRSKNTSGYFYFYVDNISLKTYSTWNFSQILTKSY